MAKLQPATGSGWRLHSIIKLELHTVRYNPLRGETYFKLPKELGNKDAIINPKNEDNKCFLWCVLRALHPCEKNPQRIDKKKKRKTRKEKRKRKYFKYGRNRVSRTFRGYR